MKKMMLSVCVGVMGLSLVCAASAAEKPNKQIYKDIEMDFVAEGRRGGPGLGRGDLSERVTKLELKNRRLSQAVQDLNARLDVIEDLVSGGRGGGGHHDRHPQILGKVCLLVASSFHQVYVGQADTQLDAEFKANEQCSSNLHSKYCTGGNLQCEEITSDSETVCVVTASAYNRKYRGEGQSELLAKYEALKSCEKDLHAKYCSSGAVKCEAKYQ